MNKKACVLLLWMALMGCAGPEPVTRQSLWEPSTFCSLDTSGLPGGVLEQWGLQALQLELKPSGHYGFQPSLAFLMKHQGQWQISGGQLWLWPADGGPARPGALRIATPAQDTLWLRFACRP